MLLQNIYNDSDGGWISEQKLANGTVYRYQYVFVKNDIVTMFEYQFQRDVFKEEVLGRTKDSMETFLLVFGHEWGDLPDALV